MAPRRRVSVISHHKLVLQGRLLSESLPEQIHSPFADFCIGAGADGFDEAAEGLGVVLMEIMIVVALLARRYDLCAAEEA